MRNRNRDIAVIGMACRFPGGDGLTGFWELLAGGGNAVREIPPERWDNVRYFSDKRQDVNTSISKWGALLDGVDGFDHRFFNISPREAASMDPQQRLLLQESWHCLEHSGVPLATLQQRNTSVYTGVMTVDYRQFSTDPNGVWDGFGTTGSFEGMLANRISYQFGFRGASQSVNAACASFLVAVHEAKQSLLAGNSDYALVCATNLNLHPWKYVSFSKLRMLSPNGQCRTFDKDADGYVPGDGIAAVLLQRKDKALKEGNTVHGIIRGSAVNHNGRRSPSITAPSVESQREVILSAYTDAGLAPLQATYTESHGTGTSLGDPIEVEALRQVFNAAPPNLKSCVIGSVKGNIGHLEAVSGAAGMIKLLLMMKHRQIPPSLHVAEINPMLALERTPFTLADSLCDWNPAEPGEPLRAGLSSFGFGGANAHIIMEEYVEPPLKNMENAAEAHTKEVLLLSAKSAASLERQVQRWRDWAAASPSVPLGDVCGTLANGREQFPVRTGFMVSSMEELAAGLKEWTMEGSPYGEGKRGFSLAVSNLSAPHLSRIKASVRQGPRRKPSEQLMKYAMRAGCDREEAEEFVYGYSYLKMLEDAGFCPLSLRGEGRGRWTGLAFSGLAEPEQVLMLMAQGPSAVDVLQWKRPVMRLELTGLESPVEVHGFDAGYVRQMAGIAKELSVPGSAWEADFSQKLDKSRKLLTYQHTFIQMMEEWRTVLQSVHGADLWEWLDTTRSLDLPGQAIVYLAVTDALHRLNRKWSFAEMELCADPRLQDWMELLKGPLTREEAVKLFLDSEPDYAAIATALQIRWSGGNAGLDYPYARQQPFQAAALLDSLYIEPSSGEVPKGIDVNETSQHHTVWFGTESTDTGTMLTIGRADRPDDLYRQDLLALWLKGAEMNWMLCYPEGRYRKVPLPVYCFEEQSFGVSAKRLRMQEEDPSADRPDAPQMAQHSVPPMEDPPYDCRHRLVRDHRIGGRHPVPGACMIRTALDTIRLHEQWQGVWMERVLLQRPVIPNEKDSIRFQGRWHSPEFSVMAGDETVCKGRAFPLPEPAGQGEAGILSGPIPQDIAAVSPYSPAQLYASLERAGYSYGHCLRVMQSGLVSASGEWLFVLQTGEPHETGRLLDEVLLDGVFQAMLAAGFLEGTLAFEPQVYVPFIVTSLKLYGCLAGPGSYQVKLGDRRAVNGNYFASAAIFDKEGRKVLDMEEVMFRRSGANPQHQPSEGQAFGYEPYWRNEDLGISGLSGAASGRIALLLTAEESQLHGRLSALLHRRYEHVYSHSFNQEPLRSGREGTVSAGRGASGIPSPLLYEAPPEEGSPYPRLLDELSHRWGPLNGRLDIYYMLSWEPEANPYNWPDQLERGVLGLFDLSQALLQAKVTKAHLVAAVSDGGLRPEDKGSGFGYGAMAGFIRSVSREHPGLAMKIVELDDSAASSAPELLLAEGLSPVREVWAAYRNKERFVSAFRPWLPAEERAGSVFREQGTYIIAGGAGGIGFQLLSHLRKLNRELRMAVLGRSELSGDKRRAWDTSFADDPNLLYIRCDVTDEQQLQRAIARICNLWGPIHGVFQAGGILADGLLAGKSRAVFEEVLAVKTAGTWNLHKLTLKEPLDFFVVFSSVVGSIGNAGQSDYASANAFLDAFIHYRASGPHPGKSLSIGWTLWEEGGMGRSPGHRDIFAGKAGILPTSAALGMLEPLIAAAAPQYIVVGDALAFESQLPKSEAGVNKMADNLSQVQAALMRLLSGIIEVPETEFDADTDLREYGLESVLLTELAEQIGNFYGVALNPTLFFEYPDIKSLACYLSERYDLTSPAENALQPEQPAAHLSLNPVKEQSEATADTDPLRISSEQKNNGRDIAIIGMTGRFPGADNLDEYQSHLQAGNCTVTEITGDRWDWREAYGDPSGIADKTRSKWGGLLNGIRNFDAEFFRISRREAELMDPQQRLLLEEAWRVLESAGYKPSSLRGSDTGVFIGICNDDYNDLLVREGVRQDAYASTGTFFAMASNRISYAFDWHGPSVSVDTACSSSLVALHQAVQAIQQGDCSMAVAGGVNICCSPKKHFSFDNAGMLSADGRCKTFDERADGYVRGEGLGLLLLKPLNQALADGDLICGIIKGSAVNHGGKANSLTAPNPVAQASLITTAYTRAGIHPSTVGYIEAHGTGTSLGDPVEINGLKKAFQQLYARNDTDAVPPAEPHCVIGSVKPSIGHLESAAGIAGVIRVLLAMKSGRLAGMKHIERLNPYIELAGSPFLISREDREWKRLREPEGGLAPRRGGVSSFGFGGVNAHVVLEQYERSENRVTGAPALQQGPELLVLSARTEASLLEAAAALAGYLRTADRAAAEAGSSDDVQASSGAITLPEVAYTLQTGRDALEERLGLIVQNLQEAADALEDIALNGRTMKVPFYRNHVELSGGRKGLPHAAGLPERAAPQAQPAHGLLCSVQDWMRLAGMWTAGEPVEWEQYRAGVKPGRIPLPTYRFLGEEYWLPTAVAEDSTVPSGKDTLRELDGGTWSCHWNGNEQELVRLTGSQAPLLTNWTILATVLQAAERQWNGRLPEGMGLSGIRWAQPCIPLDGSAALSVSFFTAGSETGFEVAAGAGGMEILCQGMIQMTSRDNSPPAHRPQSEASADVQELYRNCRIKLGAEEAGEWGRQTGAIYTSGALESLHYSENPDREMLLHFRFGVQQQLESSRRFIPILEESMQAVSLIRAKLMSSGEASGGERGLLCPFSIEKMVTYRNIDEECLVYVSYEAPNSGSAEPVGLNLRVMDPKGDCCLLIQGLTAYKYGAAEHMNQLVGG